MPYTKSRSQHRAIGASSLESLRQHARPIDLRALAFGVAAWAAGALIAFRAVHLSLFDVVFGGRGDGRLIVYLHEHLFNALRSRADFLSPPIFYPQKHVLGFTDAFMLDLLPYAALRMIGLDPFLSVQIWAVILSFFCFMASLIIGMRYLRLRPGFAIAASALVTFPNNLMFKTAIAHINFFALYYLPCILLLALWGIEDFPQLSRTSLIRVGAAAALFALLFSTGYYVSWMFALTMGIALITAAVLSRHQVIAAARNHYRPFAVLAATATFGFAVGLIPLVLIYAPVLGTFPGRTFAEYLFFTPGPVDVFNVGRWNMVWGHLVDRLVDAGGAERTLAVTPVMTVVVLIIAYQLRKGIKEGGRWPWALTFVVACAAVWTLSWLLTAKIGNFSLFWLLYHIVPGAAAIRAGGRIQLLVNLWVVAGLAVALQYWIDTASGSRYGRRVLLAGTILIFCLIEQINVLPVTTLSRSREFAWLSAVPEAPAQCGAFLVDVPSRQASFLDENDALWISLRTGLPTLNGNSGWLPRGWRLEDHTIDYFDAAREWIATTGLNQTVCLYDRSNRSWSTFWAAR